MNVKKNVETMTDNEIMQLASYDHSELFELVRSFFSREEEEVVTRSIIVAMLVLRQTDFGCLTLKGLDLSGLDFQRVNFEGSKIENCNFSGADLSDATFEYAHVQGCNFEQVKMINTFMYSGKFSECDFDKVSLLYAQELPKGFEANNYNVNTGMPNYVHILDEDDSSAVRQAEFCLTSLLDAFVEEGVSSIDNVALAARVYPYLKVISDDEIIDQKAFFEFFDSYYSRWLIGRMNFLISDKVTPLSDSGI